jgi:hypothetical protein
LSQFQRYAGKYSRGIRSRGTRISKLTKKGNSVSQEIPLFLNQGKHPRV